MKQRTITREVSIKGKSLHTGEMVRLTMKPAPAGTGVVFRRVDLYGKPELKPSIDLVTDLVRNTSLSSGNAKVHTVEHVLSALSGCGVDNVYIEIDANEPPVMDGSAKFFVNLIQEAEPIEQEPDREFFELDQPISVTNGNRSIIALPYDGLKITCTSADDRGIHTQHHSVTIDTETYITDIAPSRTFTFYEEIEGLLKLGKIRGGSLDSAIVIKGDKILSKEPLRFKDEFVRHKILDIIGDIVLLGKPLKAHIIAVRPGHAINAELTQALANRLNKLEEDKKKAEAKQVASKQPSRVATPVIATEAEMDIRRIMDILPHAFPFVLIDRVLSIVDERLLTAVKNVSINEPYFQGHYPGRPVMPGVLQVEAMAQAAGILLLRNACAAGKVAVLMSVEKVKFRQMVTPGDQLIVKVEMLKLRRNRLATAKGECLVGDKVVSSADLMFALADSRDED